MVIRLFSYSVVARGLSWEQVLQAKELANKSEAGKQFQFAESLDEQSTHPIKRWALHAMPNIYFETTFEGKDAAGWFIKIDD